MSKLKLNNHDINVISCIVKHKTLPHDYLMKYVTAEAVISNDAIDIISIILDQPKTNISNLKQKEIAATDWLKWREYLTR